MNKILLISAAFIAVAAPAHADPITAIATWVGATFSVGAATALAVTQFAVGFALNAVAAALMKPDVPGANVQFDVQMGDDQPLSFTVGEYATAGKRKYLGSWGRNTRFITEVIEYSALPQGLAGIWVDDERGEFVAGLRGHVLSSADPGSITDATESASVPGGSLDIGQPLENYRDDPDGPRTTLWVKVVDGPQAAADPFLLWAFGDDPDYPWTADMVGTGKSYVIITARYDSQTLTSYPRFLLEPSPLPMYDLRLDSTNGGTGAHRWDSPATWAPTTNAAVVAYNIARGIYFGTEWVYGGKSLAAWRLPAAEWIAAANECDDAVSLAGGGTEPRYRCGMEIRCNVPAADALEEIGKAANMRFAETGGQLKPIVGLPAAAAFALTDDDIVITEGQSFKPFYPVAETFNAISATYPEPVEKWSSKDAREYIDTDATAEDGGRYLPTSMTYGAVPFRRQIRRLMRSQMRDYRRMRRHQFHLPPDAYALEPGVDMVSWTSQRNGYVSKLFMVESVAKTPGMLVLVSLREVDPGDYDWSSSFEAPPTVVVPKNPTGFVQPISGLIIEPIAILDPDGETRRPAIRVRCDGDETGVTSISLEWRETGQPEQATGRVAEFLDPYRWIIRNVLPGTSYQVRARLLSRLTTRSAWSDWFTVTTLDLALSWDDFEAEVQEAVDAAMAQAEAAAEAAADANIAADGLRDDLDAAVADLDADIAAAAALAADNLLIAQAYTDTSVQAEATTRQTATDALAAQIQTLTAVLNSENYIENPRFSDGFTGWSGHHALSTVVAQDDLSADPIIANAPTAFFASVPTVEGTNRDIYQDFSVDWLESEVFQWRCYAAVAEAGREARVVIHWYDDLGAVIGSAVQVVMTLVEDEWRVFSGQHTPPVGTVSVRFRLRVTSAVSTVPVAFADVSFTKVDQSVIARMTDLEVVVANNETAFTLHRDEALARLDDAEAAITTEAATRADADSAIASSVSTVSARVDTRNRTFRQTTAPTNSPVGTLTAGDIWYDTDDDNRPRRWSGSAWQLVDDARIAETAATVTTQATAIADIEGNLSAGYLIRAQAGGAVSFIDLIAADGSGPPTSIIKISASDIILQGSVSADMLTITDMSGNMVPDAEMVSAAAWGVNPTDDWIMLSPAGFGWFRGESAGEIQYRGPGGSLAVKAGPEFSVLQGVEYTLSGKVRYPPGATSGQLSARIRIEWLDVAGASLGASVIVSLSTDTGSSPNYAEAEVAHTAPSGARRARIRCEVLAPNEVWVGFNSVTCIRKRTGATLLTPGGVTADLITGETMRALNGEFVSLEAANITVGNAEIDTLQLAGDSVTVPAAQTLTGLIAGSGSTNWATSVNVVSLDLPQSGSVVVMWNGAHFYTGQQNRGYGLRLRINGGVVWDRQIPDGVAVGEDWPSMSWRFNLSSGSHVFRIDWNGQDDTLRLGARTLIVTGAMR